jgi:hypothetical protein
MNANTCGPTRRMHADAATPKYRLPAKASRSNQISAHPRRGGRVVECGGLENRYGCKLIGGSNPLPSAIIIKENMSRPDRLNEEKNSYFLSFEKDYSSDLNKAKEALNKIPSENEGQLRRKAYLKEWIAAQEAPMEQRAFQKQQVGIAAEANRIAKLALLLSFIALIVSFCK